MDDGVVDPPGYAVITVAYRSRALIEDLLARFDTRTRVIVVDNSAADDDLGDLAKRRPGLTVIDSGGNVGFGAACNLAAREVAEPYLAFVNPDADAGDDVLRGLVSAIDADPTVSSAGPLLVTGDGRVRAGIGGWLPTSARAAVHATGLFRLLPRRGIWFHPDGADTVDVEWIAGTCLVVRREVFLDVGGFAARYFLYQEDMDLGRRLAMRGYRQIVVGALRVAHEAGTSTDGVDVRRLAWLRASALVDYLYATRSPAACRLICAILAIGNLLRAGAACASGRTARLPEYATYVRTLLSPRRTLRLVEAARPSAAAPVPPSLDGRGPSAAVPAGDLAQLADRWPGQIAGPVESRDAVTNDAGVETPAHHPGGVGTGAHWWASRAAWAVTDQSLFAVANFALGVLLARWLEPSQFGSYAFAQSIFLLLAMLHTGLFIEPMLVFGSAKHRGHFPAYLSVLLAGHWRLTLPVALVLAAASVLAMVFGSSGVGAATLGAVLASPLILFGWLARRACLACLQPRWAATGGAIYLGCLLLGAVVLRQVGRLSPFSAFQLVGMAGLISGVWLLRRLRRAEPSSNEPISTRAVWQDHWGYGRWALAGTVLSWVPTNLPFIALPAFAGLESTGTLRAISYLFLPMTHLQDAFVSLLLPAMAASVARPVAFRRLLVAALIGFLGAAVLYGVALSLLARPLLAHLYSGTYDGAEGIVRLLAWLPVCAAITCVGASALRALGRPDRVFWCYLASSVVTVSVGMWLIARWQLTGAAMSLVLAALVTAAACWASLLWVHER